MKTQHGWTFETVKYVHLKKTLSDPFLLPVFKSSFIASGVCCLCNMSGLVWFQGLSFTVREEVHAASSWLGRKFSSHLTLMGFTSVMMWPVTSCPLKLVMSCSDAGRSHKQSKLLFNQSCLWISYTGALYLVDLLSKGQWKPMDRWQGRCWEDKWELKVSWDWVGHVCLVTLSVLEVKCAS